MRRARVWDRHLLNCAVVAEVVPDGARVVDVGSGAGLPGIPLALARPDLSVVLVEPLARRVDWLREVVEDLGLPVEIERGRAEEPGVRARWEGADVVTARAVAPLARLAGWALPLLRPGGALLALKGGSAADEVARDADAVRRLGGAEPRVVRCGVGVVDPPSTVVVVERSRADDRATARPPAAERGTDLMADGQTQDVAGRGRPAGPGRFHVEHPRTPSGRRSPRRRPAPPGCCTPTGTGCPAPSTAVC